MNTYLHVARYQLLQRLNYLVLPWTVLAFAFFFNLIIVGTFGNPTHGHNWVGGLGAPYILFLVLGTQSMSQALPFGLTLGISRRSYFMGTAVLGVAMSFAFGVFITILQAIERASSGWGVNMYFFRVPYILNGSWCMTLLTSAVFFALLFTYGIWSGLVYRRWKVAGVVAFGAAQATLLLLGALITTWSDGWSSVGHFFNTLSAGGVSGLVVALTVAIGACSFATIRRLSV